MHKSIERPFAPPLKYHQKYPKRKAHIPTVFRAIPKGLSRTCGKDPGNRKMARGQAHDSGRISPILQKCILCCFFTVYSVITGISISPLPASACLTPALIFMPQAWRVIFTQVSGCCTAALSSPRVSWQRVMKMVTTPLSLQKMARSTKTGGVVRRGIDSCQGQNFGFFPIETAQSRCYSKVVHRR